jgi:peptidase S1 and S6 chymotrypsin/hap
LDGGAAAESELQENDIITKFEGQSVSSIEELKDKLTRYEQGETVTLTVKRPGNKGYEEKEISITLKGQSSLKRTSADDKEESRDKEAESQESLPKGIIPENGDDSEEGSLFPFFGQ